MANPYYPPRSQGRKAGYTNPLAIPYPQDHPYLASSSRTTLTDTNDFDGYSDPYASHAAAGQRYAEPYYNPYANFSQTHFERHSMHTSSENLVSGGKRNSKGKPDPYDVEDRHYDEQLPLPNQPFVRGYSGMSEGQGGTGPPHDIQRPESPFDGVYEDRPPVWEKLNPEQREILKQFPPGIDDADGGKSGLQAVWALLKDWRQFFKLKYLHWWILLLISGAVVALVTIYHDKIVDWLTPISKKANSVPWGWTIPVAILFVISFPPLFGHEIVLVLVGIVYGLWIGFGIASLGTLLGEIGNFYAFKYCLQGTAAKYERKNIYYACMAEMVREGGFWVMFLARLSAVPGHFTTAIFATVGMNIWIFTLAAILALPKQLIIVYLGVAIEQAGDGGESTASKVIKYVVLAITVIITVWTAHWLYMRMEKVRPGVQRKLRQRRYNLLTDARGSQHGGGQMAVDMSPRNEQGRPAERRDIYEMQAREAKLDERGYPPSVPYSSANLYGAYSGADPVHAEQRGPPRPQREPTSPQAVQMANNSAGAIQFHRPLRAQTQDDAPETPQMESGGFEGGSDLSQARAELMQSPASPLGASQDNKAGRPNIRLDTQLNARHYQASDLGSVYLLGSEASSAMPPQGSLQPGQIVSPTSHTSPGYSHGAQAPVPALQTAYRSPTEDHASPERVPLRSGGGGGEETQSPTSHAPPMGSRNPYLSSSSGSPVVVGGYEMEAPPAYASSPHLPQPHHHQQQQQQRRVDDGVIRYQLTD